MISQKNIIKKVIQVISMHQFIYKFPSQNQIFLTFDDGPDGRYTIEILDILDKFSAKATFFLVGKNVEKYPEIVLHIRARGHSIGLHTYSHSRIDVMSEKVFREEINRNQKVIEELIAERPFMIRPPLGRLKLKNLIWGIIKGLRIVHFTITSNDWKANNLYDILNNIKIDRLTGGEIISFHDNNQNTIEAMPIFLNGLIEAGYTCESIILKKGF